MFILWRFSSSPYFLGRVSGFGPFFFFFSFSFFFLVVYDFLWQLRELFLPHFSILGKRGAFLGIFFSFFLFLKKRIRYVVPGGFVFFFFTFLVLFLSLHYHVTWIFYSKNKMYCTVGR